MTLERWFFFPKKRPNNCRGNERNKIAIYIYISNNCLRQDSSLYTKHWVKQEWNSVSHSLYSVTQVTGSWQWNLADSLNCQTDPFKENWKHVYAGVIRSAPARSTPPESHQGNCNLGEGMWWTRAGLTFYKCLGMKDKKTEGLHQKNPFKSNPIQRRHHPWMAPGSNSQKVTFWNSSGSLNEYYITRYSLTLELHFLSLWLFLVPEKKHF